jgi:hypothetical protein
VQIKVQIEKRRDSLIADAALESRVAPEPRGRMSADPRLDPRIAEIAARIRAKRQAAAAGPCEGCRHACRCKVELLACAALSLYISTGRVSAVAPRQPDRQTYRRLYRKR